MTDQTPRNEMAERLASRVQHARFAKAHAVALAGFGGRVGPDARERLALWRRAAQPALRAAAGFPPPDGQPAAGVTGDAPPPPSATRR